jgi:hypothetical protein
MQYSIAESVLVLTFDRVCVLEVSQEDTGEGNTEDVIRMGGCESSTLIVQSFQ